jgi:hypothetical protein
VEAPPFTARRKRVLLLGTVEVATVVQFPEPRGTRAANG